jgi:hypothetical protein
VRLSPSINNTSLTRSLGLEKWLADLPDALQLKAAAFRKENPSIPPPHILMIHAMYHFVVILLHRPWYSRPSRDGGMDQAETAVSKCNRAA